MGERRRRYTKINNGRERRGGGDRRDRIVRGEGERGGTGK